MNGKREGCLGPGLFVAALLLALAATGAATGATFPDLYTVSVVPDNGARDPRADAIRRGMGLLLTRITGRQQAAAYPELRNLVDNAERYLTVYAPSLDATRVGFNRAQVSRALTDLGMPIWGDERPSTLLWLAAELGNGERAELMAAGVDVAGDLGAGVPSNALSNEALEIFEAVTEEILRAADERGLPIVLPQLDEADRRHVRFADVWGGFHQFVERAAERYQVDAIIVARVTMVDTEPRVDYTVIQGERREALAPPRPRDGVDWLADEFAARYTTIGGARLTWLTVREIVEPRDFSRVLDYLESVSIIQMVDVESLTDTDLLLRVTTRGDDAQLSSYLELDGRLTQIEGAGGLEFLPSWRAGPVPRQSP